MRVAFDIDKRYIAVPVEGESRLVIDGDVSRAKHLGDLRSKTSYHLLPPSTLRGEYGAEPRSRRAP